MENTKLQDMNRNEYYEWKKVRVQELAKTGMKVADIAKELNMGEEDMYSFLSRNFGGVRRLRETLGVNPDGIVDAPLASTKQIIATKQTKQTKPTVTSGVQKIDLETVDKAKDERIGKVAQTPSVIETFRETLRKEKQSLLDSFKEELLEDKKALVEEMQQGLEATKQQLLNNFQQDFFKDLEAMAKSI